ncbi:MAG: hypothetical protein ACTHNK_04230 [Thermomicrobiales bacterium]
MATTVARRPAARVPGALATPVRRQDECVGAHGVQGEPVPAICGWRANRDEYDRLV